MLHQLHGDIFKKQTFGRGTRTVKCEWKEWSNFLVFPRKYILNGILFSKVPLRSPCGWRSVFMRRFLGEGSWKKERARQVLGLANTFFAVNKVALVLSAPSGAMKCSNLLLCHGQIFGLGCFGVFLGGVLFLRGVAMQRCQWLLN